MRKIVTTQGFEPAVIKRLRELAKQTGVPVQEIVRKAVDMYLETIKAADSPDGNLETPAILEGAGK